MAISFPISSYPQLNVTVNAPQTQGGRSMTAEEIAASQNNLRDPRSTPLLVTDILSDTFRRGFQSDYSIRDAAASLWKKEYMTFNIYDSASIERWYETQKERFQNGLSETTPSEEELTAYIEKLRQDGLDGTVDWSDLASEFRTFKTLQPDDLGDSLNYVASRYVSAMDKLERNFSGDALAEQKAKLDDIWQNAVSAMVEDYTSRLQDNLGVSDADAQAVRDSFSTILEEKIAAYQGALGQVSGALSGPDANWLQNCDAYIAARLRETETAGQSQARYSVQDLAAAGQIAQSYQTELYNASFCNRNEATLALNLAMADMKAEAMIERGLVSENMAALLRGSRAQGHQNVLDVLDQSLAKRESTRLPGEPKGTFAPVDKAVFEGIYNAVMSAYKHNGGDAAGAIRAGVSYGQTATAQAAARNPNALRWGMGIEYYWKDFYTTPEGREPSLLDKQVDALLAQIGRTSDRGSSTYQKYVNDWHSFINSIGGGLEARG